MKQQTAAISLQELLPFGDAVPAVMIARLQLDSRRVAAGDLFIALPGYRVDGREFIRDAFAHGAAAVLAESEGIALDAQREFPANVVWFSGVKNILGEIADRFFRAPSADLHVYAVTGTNGKTTVSHLLTRILELLDVPAATIGTLGYGHPDHLHALGNTTPDVVRLHGILAELRDDGCRAVAMEASSHGLDQGRMDRLRIRTAIVTNVTRDHLDYHQTMDAYVDAKARLLGWPGLDTIVLNADDPLVMSMPARISSTARVVRFSVNPSSDADVHLMACDYRHDGMHMRISVAGREHECTTRLMGTFNVANILAVVAALWAEGFDPAAITGVFARIAPVPGRMERLPSGEDLPLVIIDYAHTPDALAQVLSSARKHCKGRLWCVFGCGGNRDSGKRPLMGAVAVEMADCVVITSDNPRDEDPVLILEQIRAGIADDASVTIIESRAQAIEHSLILAGPDDVVVLAGKGHEDYQEIAGQRFPFSDHGVAMTTLTRRSAGKGMQ